MTETRTSLLRGGQSGLSWCVAVCLGAWGTHALVAADGAFVAGHHVFNAVDANRGNRSLVTDVWYPVNANDAVGQPPLQYYQHYNGGNDYWWYESPFEGGVQDTVASDAGPFPLIGLSHGFDGGTLSFQLMAESLARHGYVVVAPRHTGNAWGLRPIRSRCSMPIVPSI